MSVSFRNIVKFFPYGLWAFRVMCTLQLSLLLVFLPLVCFMLAAANGVFSLWLQTVSQALFVNI